MRTVLIIAALGLLVLLVVPLWGCGKPAQLGPDEEAFREVDALFTAVTARRPELVDQCEARLRPLRERGKLPDAPPPELRRVIDRARDGRWQAAAERLYEFMKGQERPVVDRERERRNEKHPRANR